MRLKRTVTFASVLLATTMLCVTAAVGGDRMYGALQSDPARAASLAEQGIRTAVLSVNWSLFEPQPGQIDETYVQKLSERIEQFRKAGSLICVDLSVHYMPGWVRKIPNSRYINQYGETYKDSDPGMDMLNGVFNQKVRDAQARHAANVFDRLGTDFYAIRLGWGQYGELCYPRARYNDSRNCFWAYDAIAQGEAAGLAEGLGPCPVPGWVPGQSSEDHRDARAFVDWYIGALVNYQNWQIDEIRKHYGGRLMVMYPSWGLRPGLLEELVEKDLASDTQEVQRGLDYKRLVEAVDDPKTIVYCTWMDGNFNWVHDDEPDPAFWSPMHYLAYLAHNHPLKLKPWGENSATPSSPEAMELCFERMRKYDIEGMVWAFERNLYDDSGKYASLDQYIKLIKQNEQR